MLQIKKINNNFTGIIVNIIFNFFLNKKKYTYKIYYINYNLYPERNEKLKNQIQNIILSSSRNSVQVGIHIRFRCLRRLRRIVNWSVVEVYIIYSHALAMGLN